MPYSSLKHLVKYDGEENPTSYAISAIPLPVCSSYDFALCRRDLRSRSTTEMPITAFTLR